MIEQSRNWKMQRNKNRLKTIHAYIEGINLTTSLCDSFDESIWKNSMDGRKCVEKYNPHNGNYSQEYQRLQENQRIIKRIINPKRCKIIQRSIENIKTLQRPGTNAEQRIKSQHHSRKKTTKTINFRDQFSNLYEKCPFLTFTREDYDLKVQNERMGRRILYAKPIVRSNFAESPSKRSNSRVNKGVIAFFNTKANSRQGNNQNLQSSRLKTHYGYGPTILSLRNIKISINPPLKNDDLLFLELLVKNSNPKLYKTQIISYLQLLRSEFKFALRIKRIGQYVPLRVWRIHNMNSIEIGIVDIQFSKYLNMQQEYGQFIQENKQNQHGMVLANKQSKMKTVIKDKIECKLRKTKVEETHGEISLEFLIYRKKYI